jgi:hypothetical protein
MMYNSNVLLSAALLLSSCSAAPIEQLPLESKPAAGYPFKNDPYDRKHDTYGDGVQPLPVVSSKNLLYHIDLGTNIPQRNGHGTSVLGPVNKDRDRQNPDLVRPPSTDHGILPNLRWYGLSKLTA